MQTKEQNLIQVKTLTKKLANQIEKVTGSWHPKWREIWTGLQDHYAEIRVLYWARGSELEGISDTARVWLLEINHRDLFWVLAPSDNHKIAKHYHDLEQLFIS